MGIFKSKNEKELEKRLIIKRTINDMNKQINKLEEQKKVFIEKAKQSKKLGLNSQYCLALSGYKMTVTQQRQAQEMLLNFEMTSQLKDISLMTRDFLKGMGMLSHEMVKLSDNKEFLAVQEQFEKAMSAVGQRAEQMEVFMDFSKESFKNTSKLGDVDEKEFENLVGESIAQEEGQLDPIDKELEDIKKKLDAEGQ